MRILPCCRQKTESPTGTVIGWTAGDGLTKYVYVALLGIASYPNALSSGG